MWQDVRYALRTCRNSGNFTLAVVVSLALGIGTTSAFFSVVYGVLIDPYVYKDVSRIVVPTYSEPDSDGRRPPLYYTLADFMDFEKNAKSFESVMLTSFHMAVTEDAMPRNVDVRNVSANYFEFLGTPALLGRTFARGDIPQVQNPPPLAVVGYKFWMREFGGRDVIGRDLKLGADDYKVIGVMPPRFTWFDTDVYTVEPMRAGSEAYVSVYFKLRKGVDLRSASAELQSLTERAARKMPAYYPKLPSRMYAVPLQEWLNGEKGSGKWLILMRAVCMLLAIRE